MGYEVAFAVVGFVFTPALVSAGTGLRVFGVGLVVALAWLLTGLAGAARGERDSALSETLGRLAQKGEYTPAPEEKARCFSRSKAVLAALVGASVVLVAALCVAVTAKPYAYTLQGLPDWLGGYVARPEIGEALSYLENVKTSAVWTDYVRVGVRFALFPYVALMGTMTDAASLLFDRLCPLFSLLVPASYAVGYQFGPARRAKAVKQIEEAKHRPRKRLKKEARQRLKAREPQKKELI